MNKEQFKVTGLMFIELLLVLAVIMLIAFAVFKLYFKGSSSNKQMQKAISGQGIDATSPRSIIGSTKKKLLDIQVQRSQDLGNIGNE